MTELEQVADRAVEDVIAVLMAQGLTVSATLEAALRQVVIEAAAEVWRAAQPQSKTTTAPTLFGFGGEG